MPAEWWLNLAAFLGVAVLAVPVWSLNLRKKRLQRIRDADAAGDTDESFRRRVRAILRDRRERDVAEWRRVDEIRLAGGYLLVFGSAGLRLALPLVG
ncbi:MAG: hypothetical protein QM699_10850 [Amaricoccus sp.]|uniref:hypothetical protein n=1 Tax=Amaricoccus sp. TaxID=1872485 RepID=UPI0039E546C5